MLQSKGNYCEKAISQRFTKEAQRHAEKLKNFANLCGNLAVLCVTQTNIT
jgi:hypothetical protein